VRNIKTYLKRQFSLGRNGERERVDNGYQITVQEEDIVLLVYRGLNSGPCTC
jgi:hypothetical protein